MIRASFTLFMLQLIAVSPVLAHGGHEHIGDWQMIINGVGIIAIVIFTAVGFLHENHD